MVEQKSYTDSKVQTVEKVLERHPFLKFCFEKYIHWAFSKSATIDLTDFPLIDTLLKNSSISPKAQELEDKLQRAMRILNVRKEEFRRMFGFQDELLTDDTEKIHNILAEPLFVLDLDDYSFKSIGRPFVASSPNGKQQRLADFTANRGGEKFAVELKTTMMEKDIENGKLLSGDREEARMMLLNNCLIKIKEENRRVFEQLTNTQRLFHCTKRMIAFYSRRLRVLAYLERQDFIDVARDVLSRYGRSVDYVAIKNYDASEVLFYPALDRT
ncbi:MAG: hypothetical protein WBF13_09555 [Candidatus Zixiibacteriota bacterium]